jgi:hypothetical protein
VNVMPTSRNRHLQRGGIRCIGIPDCTTTTAGASTKELMIRLGHASSTAALRYQHGTSERDAAIASALAELALGSAEVVPIGITPHQRSADVS